MTTYIVAIEFNSTDLEALVAAEADLEISVAELRVACAHRPEQANTAAQLEKLTHALALLRRIRRRAYGLPYFNSDGGSAAAKAR